MELAAACLSFTVTAWTLDTLLNRFCGNPGFRSRLRFPQSSWSGHINRFLTLQLALTLLSAVYDWFRAAFHVNARRKLFFNKPSTPTTLENSIVLHLTLKMNGDPKTSRFKYFSYGSNLLRERILINNPTAEIYGIGKLSGYRLMFDTPVGCEKSKWYGAHATIRSGKPEEYVYGVIWNVHIEDMDSLDSQETCYDPIEVHVVGDHGETVICRTYEMIQDTINDTLPSPHYKKVVVDGARQNELPQEYIDFLESFPDNGVTDTPPNYRKVLDMVEILNEEENGENPLMKNDV